MFFEQLIEWFMVRTWFKMNPLERQVQLAPEHTKTYLKVENVNSVFQEIHNKKQGK